MKCSVKFSIYISILSGVISGIEQTQNGGQMEKEAF